MREALNIFGVKASGERFSSYLLFEKKVLADTRRNQNSRRIKMINLDWILAYQTV